MKPNNNLRPYQEEGVRRMMSLGGNVLLADEPGLGKTIQVIEYINRTRPRNVYIVCPAHLRLTWQRELDRWLDHDALIDICSYEELCKFPRGSETDLAVFDEAHYLKNSKAKRTKAAAGVQAKRWIFVTGTPVVNRPIDIFPILKMMGMRMDRNDFGKRYCAGKLKPVQWCNGKPSKYAWDFSGASNIEELNRILTKHCMIRRAKKDVLAELPRKIRTVLEIAAPSKEPPRLRTAVERMFRSFKSAESEIREAKKIAFEELSRHRLELARAKLPFVTDYLTDILLEEEEKVVVFAYHREIIDELAGRLNAGGIRTVKIYGGTGDRSKDAAVSEFQNGSARVLVGQIQAAGTGLTLTAASTVLFAELDWVPGNIIQAEDRCHRFGQSKTVRVIHLVLAGSVDGMMVRAMVRKQETIEKLVS